MGKSAAARRSSAAEPLAPPVAPPPAPPLEDPAADAVIAEVQQEHFKPPKTLIHRVDPDTGERKFLGDVVTEMVTLEWLGRRYGGGKYALTHRKADASGGYKYAAHETVQIDESIQPDPPAPSSVSHGEGARPTTGAAPANVIQQAMEAGVLSLIQQMQNQNQLTVAMIERLTKGDDRRGPPLLELITPFIPVIVELVKSRKDPTDMAVQLAGLMTKQRDAGAGPEQLVTMLEKGVSLATKLGGDRASGGSGESVMPIVSEGVKMLGDVVSAIIAERAQARLAAGSSPGQPVRSLHLVPDPVPESSMIRSTPPTPAVPDRPWLQIARPQLPGLVSAARFMPPDAAAATIAANLTPAAFDDLVADIEDDTAPGFIGRLVAQFPGVATINPQWFQTMLTYLLEAAGPEPLEEGDDTASTTPA